MFFEQQEVVLSLIRLHIDVETHQSGIIQQFNLTWIQSAQLEPVLLLYYQFSQLFILSHKGTKKICIVAFFLVPHCQFRMKIKEIELFWFPIPRLKQNMVQL